MLSGLASTPSRRPLVVAVVPRPPSFHCPVTSRAGGGITVAGSLLMLPLYQSWVVNPPQKAAHKLSASSSGCPLTQD